MNKKIVLFTLTTLTLAGTIFCNRDPLRSHEHAWKTPIKEDETITIKAHHVALAADQPEGIVTIRQKGDHLWTVRGEKPGNVALMIQRSKKGKALAHPYRIVEPKI